MGSAINPMAQHEQADILPGSVREMMRRLRQEAQEAEKSVTGDMVRQIKADLAEKEREQLLGWAQRNPTPPKSLTLTGTDDRGRVFRITLKEIA